MAERHPRDIGPLSLDMPEELRWWVNLAPMLSWRLAKTKDHSYVVRGKTLLDPDFTRAVKVIRRYGRPGKFYRQTMIYLIVDGVKWWTMGAPLEDTVIINTTTDLRDFGTQDAPDTLSRHPDVPWINAYDQLAPDYDARYDTPECRAENRWVWELITRNSPTRPTMLDIGAGTGLALDLHLTTPTRYIALDPSQAMLNELLRKHQTVSRVWPLTMEQAIEQHVFSAERFEVVISLFGSCSYIHPDAIAVLPSLATKLLVLMHMEPGYLPDYQPVKPPYLDTSRMAARLLLDEYQGETIQLGHFQVTILDLESRPRPPLRIPDPPSQVNMSPTAEFMASG
jgi:SAM-dependent methyltransferase